MFIGNNFAACLVGFCLFVCFVFVFVGFGGGFYSYIIGLMFDLVLSTYIIYLKPECLL